jgi:Novel STAND NTPase 1
MGVGARPRYPGAQPFADDDLSRKLFRGREREATLLTNQILANRLVVLFARSGVGKTSLLNAGVAENLRAEGLLPLTVRVNNISLGPLESLYFGIADACARQHVEYIPGDKTSLWHFFKTAEFWTKDTLQIPVLILDQFEELFTLQSKDQRSAFIDQLSNLIRGVRPSISSPQVMDKDTVNVPISDAPPKIKVLISLREDFFPDLEEIADRIPDILHQIFRLQPLARVAASRALEEPASIEDPSLATRPFELESKGRDTILDFLAWRAPSEIKKSATDIEPFQLQLLCQHVEEIAQKKQHQDSQNGVKVMANEIGDWSDLGSILEDFYLKQVGAISSFRQRRAVRVLCREFLISPLGRRLRMEETEIKRHTSVDPTTLRTLVDHRLLRADQTPEGTYYELSHDSLINAVLGSSRWSFTFRAGLYLFAGALWLFFGFSFFSYIFVWPVVFWQSKHEWDDVLMLGVVVPFSGLVGWLLWRAGIQNLKKYKDMRHRSRISRGAALPIERAT